jgi:hypothetical protein
MANKAKSDPVVAVMAMSEISKLNQADAVNLFVDKTTAVTRAFMDSAKLIVHIRSTMTKAQTVHGLLGKKGIRTSTINNAMQAVRVWDALVVRELITEKQFDKLSYSSFVEVNSAIKVKGVEAVGILVAAANLAELEHIAEHKETSAETKAKHDAKPAAAEPAKAPEKKPEPKPAPAKKSEPEKTPEGEPVTTLTEPEKKDVTTLEADVTNIVEMPRKDVTLADGEALIDSLQNVFAELSEADFIVLSGKLVELTDLVVEKEAALRSKKKAA